MVHVSSVFTQISPFTLDVTTNKYLYSAAGNAKIYLKNHNSITPLSHSWPKQPSKRVISLIHCSFLQVHWHYSFHFLGHCFFHFFWTLFLPLSWTLFLPLFLDTISSTFFGHYFFHFLGHCFFHFFWTLFLPLFLDTISSTFLDTVSSTFFGHYFFHFLGHYFFHFLGSYFFFFFSLWGTTPYLFSFLNSWVSTPPSQLGWFLQDAPAWVCQPSSLQYLCLHTPGSAFWSRSRLLPSTSSTKVASHLVSCDLQDTSWLWFAYRRTKLWAAYRQLPRASLTTEE